MVSLNDLISGISPQSTQSPKGLVNLDVVGDDNDELWITYRQVRPDGNYEEAVNWKFALIEN